jgi:membrane-bound lytic murein transglycosylase MltF
MHTSGDYQFRASVTLLGLVLIFTLYTLEFRTQTTPVEPSPPSVDLPESLDTPPSPDLEDKRDLTKIKYAALKVKTIHGASFPRAWAHQLTQTHNPIWHVAFAAPGGSHAIQATFRNTTDSLYFAAAEFLDSVRNDDMLDRFRTNQMNTSRQLDFVNTHTFLKHLLERLPNYRALFRQVAAQYRLDWRLLAAMAYQESHWNPKAVSPTGVRGLMMLTQRTATQLGIENRLDPEQSVKGGARYLIIVKNKIPQRIPEPDRTWLAVASYNVGFGHLEDARILTQKFGRNPDKWVDVKQQLPLLSDRKWHEQTKRGYARGHEPVVYVKNIQYYYEMLVWLTRNEPKQWNVDAYPYADSRAFS